jgi:hypothetical protein
MLAFRYHEIVSIIFEKKQTKFVQHAKAHIFGCGIYKNRLFKSKNHILFMIKVVYRLAWPSAVRAHQSLTVNSNSTLCFSMGLRRESRGGKIARIRRQRGVKLCTLSNLRTQSDPDFDYLYEVQNPREPLGLVRE